MQFRNLHLGMAMALITALFLGIAGCKAGGSIAYGDVETAAGGTSGGDDGTGGDDGAVDGGGDEPLPVASYIYGGALAKGDALLVEIDVPAEGRFSVQNLTTAEDMIVPYWIMNDHYVYELATEVYGRGWVQPGGYAAFMNPSTMDSELMMAMAIDPAITDLTVFSDKSYIGIQFQHRDDGANFLLSDIAGDGSLMVAMGKSIAQPPDPSAATDVSLADFAHDAAHYCFVAVTPPARDRLPLTRTAFAREGVMLIDMGEGEGFAILMEQPAAVIPDGVAVGDVYRGFSYKRDNEFEVENYESTMTVTARPTTDTVVVDIVSPGESNAGVTVAPAGDDWPGFLTIPGGETAMFFLSADVIVFADNHGVWGFGYGIAFRE